MTDLYVSSVEPSGSATRQKVIISNQFRYKISLIGRYFVIVSE